MAGSDGDVQRVLVGREHVESDRLNAGRDLVAVAVRLDVQRATDPLGALDGRDDRDAVGVGNGLCVTRVVAAREHDLLRALAVGEHLQSGLGEQRVDDQADGLDVVRADVGPDVFVERGPVPDAGKISCMRGRSMPGGRFSAAAPVWTNGRVPQTGGTGDKMRSMRFRRAFGRRPFCGICDVPERRCMHLPFRGPGGTGLRGEGSADGAVGCAREAARTRPGGSTGSAHRRGRTRTGCSALGPDAKFPRSALPSGIDGAWRPGAAGPAGPAGAAAGGLRGPAGEPGAAGADGAAGPMGPAAGPAGRRGRKARWARRVRSARRDAGRARASGTPGRPGRRGPEGEHGEQGLRRGSRARLRAGRPAGLKGDAGATGATGVAGDPGSRRATRARQGDSGV